MTIPLDTVRDEFRNYFQFDELKSIAEHYNIFKDLFDCGYFYPVIPFDIKYDTKNIYFGNKLSANEVHY